MFTRDIFLMIFFHIFKYNRNILNDQIIGNTLYKDKKNNINIFEMISISLYFL